MSTIKKSHLKEIFSKYGLSEGIFDIFNSKRKQLDKKLAAINKEVEATIAAAPTKADRKRLQNLADAFDKVKVANRALK